MLWVPTAKVVVLNVALPLARVPVPMVLPPSLKVTLPVGELPVTAAVKVMAWPDVICVTDALKLVVEDAGAACVTVTETAVEVDDALFVSPP